MAEEPTDPSAGGASRDEPPRPTDDQGRLSVLIEIRAPAAGTPSQAFGMAERMDAPGFTLDPEFQPVPMAATGEGAAAAGESFILRGTVDSEEDIAALRARPEVIDVHLDTPIAPFDDFDRLNVELDEAKQDMAVCPIPPCDCTPGTPRGTIADVASYLGASQIWAAGFRGAGIVVGVVDGGITAQGRPVKSKQTPRRISRVINGWPSDWGTESRQWGDHGNMCATDVLGMAPDAQIYDFRVAGAGGSAGTISRALQAFQWAIDRHKVDGTPHVLTNSWGIFEETWDPSYARNANHPFTRKVVEAINEGILVLFAAGNCGGTCPDNRCGPDTGSGKSIWGANGHPAVMTVGAVNRNEQFIGYSSQGPAALDPSKPDFCSISHFMGYFNSDTGTSAATPILAGVVALLKHAAPTAGQSEIKAALKSTAKDIGAVGFDTDTGSGIVQGKRAFDLLRGPSMPRTLAPPCPPRTLTPPCPPRTLAPPCPPIRTFGPACPPPTLAPPCPPIRTFGPWCPPRTLAPPCPPIRTFGPACPPRTLACEPPATAEGYELYSEYGYPSREAYTASGEYGYPSATDVGATGELGYPGSEQYAADAGEYGYPGAGEYELAQYGFPDPYGDS